MNTLELIARPLIAAASDSAALAAAYSQYVQVLRDGSLWSVDNPSRIRVSWQNAASAAKHVALRDAFQSPGLYLFGCDLGVPLYMGMTTQPLWKRLRGRYVRGARSQCQLATDYQADLVARGIDGFPDSIREWYRKNYRTSTARLRGAVAFARSGPDRIWFTLIPISDSGSVRDLERTLIPIANDWNRSHGHPQLLNDQDI